MSESYIPLIRDNYFQQLENFIDKDVIKVITGQRRSGKSYLLLQLIKTLKKRGVPTSNIIYINKEDSQFDHLHNYHDLTKYLDQQIKKTLKKHKVYILIDEVQEIVQFEKSIRSFRLNLNNDIYVTGSNSSIVSSDISTYLAGRYIEIKVYPLSFKEFIYFLNLEDSKESLKQYLKFGGLPYLRILGLQEEIVYIYLENLINTILLKDIVKRYDIRNVDLLERLVAFIADNIGAVFSANSISKFLKREGSKISPNIIINYLHALKSSYFIHEAKRFDIKGKRIFARNSKYYFTDIGLRNYFKGLQPTDINKVIENVVYMHLLAHGYQVYVGIIKGKEIDFVAHKKNKCLYIQVAYLLTGQTTREREFENLLLVPDYQEKLVVSLDPITTDYQGIKHLHLWEFLHNY